MRLFAQAAEIPEVFDGAAQLPIGAMVAVGGLILSGVVAFLIYRQRRISREPRSTRRLSREA